MAINYNDGSWQDQPENQDAPPFPDQFPAPAQGQAPPVATGNSEGSGGISGKGETAVLDSGSTSPVASTGPLPPQTDATTATPAPSPYSGYQNTFNDAMHNAILKNLNAYSQTPSITDANLAPQASAYQGARERAQRQQQESNAERAHAYGMTTGSLDSATNQGYEKMGQDIGSYNAGLVGNESNARRTALLNSLGLGAGLSAAGGSNQLGQDTLGANIGMFDQAQNDALMRALMGA